MMKKMILISLISLSTTTYSSDGEIRFIGRILEGTCTSSSTNINHVIRLNETRKTELDTRGVTTGEAPLQVQLSKCPESTGIRAYFNPIRIEVLPSGDLLNTASDDANKNIEIQLLNENSIALKNDDLSLDLKKIPKGVKSDLGGEVRFNYKARYFANHVNQHGNTVDNRLIYIIEYD